MIRQALTAERPEVLETVTAAFRRDPAWRFLLGSEYERLAPKFAGALFDMRMISGSVWVTEDLAAVAMWDRPDDGDRRPRKADRVWASYRAAAGGPTSGRLDVYNRAVAAASSRGCYWYLGVLATHPSRQGEGLATAVLAPVLEAADEEGMACCLETSTEANRAFYARRGFTEATDVVIANGPPTWWLRRARQGVQPQRA